MRALIPYPGTVLRRCFGCGLVIAGAALAHTLGAQEALCVLENGKLLPVARAAGRTAFVNKDGKWVAFREGPFVLHPLPEYAPALVQVEHFKFGKGARAISENGALTDVVLMNGGRFVLNAEFEASRSLDNVVLLLVLADGRNPDLYYVREVGRLEAHQVKRFSVDELTEFKLRQVRLKRFYLFANGEELLTSRMPESLRAKALAAMVQHRLEKAKDGAAHPLFLDVPVFPASLPTKVKGQAVVDCQVDVQGRVLDPKVASATDPAFGAALLAAVSKWRFVPAVKAGKPVESVVSVPWEFAP